MANDLRGFRARTDSILFSIGSRLSIYM